MVFNCHELVLNLRDLILFFLHGRIIFLNLFFKFLPYNFFLILVHFTEFLMSLNISLNRTILFFNHINLRVKDVHVVIKWIVLLFSFNKSSYNFFCGTDSRLLFYLIKSMLNNLHIFFKICQKLMLWNIPLLPLCKSLIQKSNGIWKLSGLCLRGIHHRWPITFRFSFIKVSVISLLKFVLKIFDFLFESVFFWLMLCL